MPKLVPVGTTTAGAATLRLPAIPSWRTLTALTVILALLQGLTYCFLVPPWQHYDEPTHFEYAWLIANRGHLPREGDQDPAMRREVAASMIAHRFYWNLPQPDIITGEPLAPIGISELVHPPAYYLVVSVPLFVARGLDITSQLYIARLVSIVFFVLTVAIALALAAELFPAGQPLRWMMPLLLVLLPPFADIMSAVNNDVGAVFVFSLFLWLGVRTIRRGPSWRRGVLLAATAALATQTKTTASVAVILIPLVFLLGVWRRPVGTSRLILGSVGLFVLLLASTLTWGDAAYWYRSTAQTMQVPATQVRTPDAPHGLNALQLLASPRPQQGSILSPLLPASTAPVAGHEATVGGWIWGTRPGLRATINVDYNTPGSASLNLSSHPITLTTTPAFVGWTISVPATAEQLRYRLTAEQSGSDDARVLLDGALLVPGRFPTATAPSFTGADARKGRWDGREFTNLVRNASFERTWPHLRPWIDRTLVTYTRRSPALVLAALFDVQRTGRTLLIDVPARLLFSFFGVFAWGHISLRGAMWQPIFLSLVACAAAGWGLWIGRGSRSRSSGGGRIAAFLTIAGGIVWLNAILRVLPMLDGTASYLVARYGFPGAIPAVLFLAGGWWALWPRRLRPAAAIALVIGFMVLNVIALRTIGIFYASVSN